MQVSFGESHKVVGGHPSLGDWDVSNAPQMQWNDGNVWTLEVQLPEGSDIEFKVTANLYMPGSTCEAVAVLHCTSAVLDLAVAHGRNNLL